MTRKFLPLNESSINKEMKIRFDYHSSVMRTWSGVDYLSFKVKLLGFKAHGKTLTSLYGDTYKADGELLEVKMEFTNLQKKAIDGNLFGKVLVLEDEEGFQFPAPGNDLQEKTKRSYRFTEWSKFLPKIPVECSLFFDVPNAEGKYRLIELVEDK